MSRNLRSKLIRLANSKPELRPTLLPLLKEAAWEDGDALKLKLIETFPNEEDGTEGRVFDLGHQGYSAMLFDVDSGNTVGGRIYPREMKQKALDYAKKIAQGGGGSILRLAGGKSDKRDVEEGLMAYHNSALSKFDVTAQQFGRKFHAIASKLRLNDDARAALWRYITDISYEV
jgi:hypothetical protein